jgi:hypothetical protein
MMEAEAETMSISATTTPSTPESGTPLQSTSPTPPSQSKQPLLPDLLASRLLLR